MLNEILSIGFLTSLLAGTIRLATPILMPALGQIYTQRAGILNLGVEGTMLIASILGFAAVASGASLWVGFIVGIITGAVYALLMAWLSVTLRVNQVIAGIGMNVLATGLAAYIYRLLFGIRALPAKITSFPAVNIPWLSGIPYLGTILFQHNILVYLAFAMVPLTWFFLEKTMFGLKIKMVGEHPRAADSRGISVPWIRYAAVVIGGAYAGAGGVFMTIAYLNMFTESVIGGFGYIAVSVVIFGRFDPYRAMGGALLFGFASALQVRLQALGSGIPSQLLLMLPYALTIVALIFASKKAEFPSAYTIPYSRMER